MTLDGIFKLEVFLPDDYPMVPPKIRFLTKIYHPNIDEQGRVCLDVLQGDCYVHSIYHRRDVYLLTCCVHQRPMESHVANSNHFAKRPGSSRGPEP